MVSRGSWFLVSTTGFGPPFFLLFFTIFFLLSPSSPGDLFFPRGILAVMKIAEFPTKAKLIRHNQHKGREESRIKTVCVYLISIWPLKRSKCKFWEKEKNARLFRFVFLLFLFLLVYVLFCLIIVFVFVVFVLFLFCFFYVFVFVFDLLCSYSCSSLEQFQVALETI